MAGTKIAQSQSIERFVAKHSGLYPDDAVAAAYVDAVLEAVGDFWKAVMESTAGVDKDSPEFLEKRKECAATGTQDENFKVVGLCTGLHVCTTE